MQSSNIKSGSVVIVTKDGSSNYGCGRVVDRVTPSGRVVVIDGDGFRTYNPSDLQVVL